MRVLLLVSAALIASCASPPPSIHVERYPQPPVAGQLPPPAAPVYRAPAGNQGAYVAPAQRAATPPATAPSTPPRTSPYVPPQVAQQQLPRSGVPQYSAPQPPLPRQDVADPLDASVYRLGSGDTVRVEVLGEAELTLDALIDPSGVINYPFLGTVAAAGETVRGLEFKIRNGLRGGYLVNPDVRVSLAAYRPVFISGQVRAPGTYPYSLGLNVERAIILAGGLTPFGSTSRVYRQRNGSVGTEGRTKVSMGTAVLPGDSIIVDERLF